MPSMDDINQFFADYIKKEIGIIYSKENFYSLENRILEICHRFGFQELDNFWEFIKKNGISFEMREYVLDISTNNETYFFRDKTFFDAFEKYLIPLFKDENLVKIWCCASSTGQEVYSVLICIEELRSKMSLPPIDFLATDISSRVLQKATAGRYSELDVSRGMPQEYLQKYFLFDKDSNRPIEEKYEVIKNLRDKVNFSKQNLLESFYHIGKVDIILCRNTLIYQSDENKKNIINKLKNCLNPGGFIVFGASESLVGLSNDFEQVQQFNCILYKIRSNK